MKPRADFEQAPHASTHERLTTCRLDDAAEDLHQRALSGAVVTDDAQRLPPFHFERYVTQGPQILGRTVSTRDPPCYRLTQSPRTTTMNPESL